MKPSRSLEKYPVEAWLHFLLWLNDLICYLRPRPAVLQLPLLFSNRNQGYPCQHSISQVWVFEFAGELTPVNVFRSPSSHSETWVFLGCPPGTQPASWLKLQRAGTTPVTNAEGGTLMCLVHGTDEPCDSVHRRNLAPDSMVEMEFPDRRLLSYQV